MRAVGTPPAWSLVPDPVCNIQGEDLSVQLWCGEARVCFGNHRINISAFCRGYGSDGFLGPWLTKGTGVVCSRV